MNSWFPKIVASRKVVLVFIVLLSFFLRFYKLGINPPSLTWDEVSWGYNAYSIGINGRDEFGRFLPYDYLESFGDFKPPLYVYLDIIPIKIFGLNEFAVRFPSAFLGSLSVLVTYFLVKKMFNKEENLAIVSALLLAISPWHINLSRAAFEANIATFLILCGVLLFLQGLEKKKWHLVASFICFVLTMYTFNSARVFVPLLFTSLIIGTRKKLLRQKKDFFLACFIGLLLMLPLLRFLFSPQAALRFKEVNIFSDLSIIQKVNQEMENDGNSIYSKIIHNRRYAYTLEFLHHYFDNISPSFLFVRGDGNPKFSTQDVGQLYFWEIFSIVIGLLFLCKEKKKFWWIVPVWFTLGIIPAATARETPHALRIETVIPTLQIVSAYGLLKIYLFFNKLRTRFFALSLICAIIIINFLYYLHGYYVHYPQEYSGEWQYGYKESIAYVNSVKDKFDKVYITNKLGRPYIYYLFYTKTNPEFFQKTALINRDSFGFVKVERFGNFYFPENLPAVKKTKEMYVEISSSVPGDASVVKTFYLLNNEPRLTVFKK